MTSPAPASLLGRPTIYAARYGGFKVEWRAARYARTIEQAEALAAMPLPPPRRWPPRSSVTAETIRIARELYEAGTSVRGIAKELDRQGIQPPRSARWHPSSVQRLLR